MVLAGFVVDIEHFLEQDSLTVLLMVSAQTILIQSELPERQVDLFGACEEKCVFSVLFHDIA